MLNMELDCCFFFWASWQNRDEKIRPLLTDRSLLLLQSMINCSSSILACLFFLLFIPTAMSFFSRFLSETFASRLPPRPAFEISRTLAGLPRRQSRASTDECHLPPREKTGTEEAFSRRAEIGTREGEGRRRVTVGGEVKRG